MTQQCEFVNSEKELNYLRRYCNYRIDNLRKYSILAIYLFNSTGEVNDLYKLSFRDKDLIKSTTLQ